MAILLSLILDLRMASNDVNLPVRKLCSEPLIYWIRSSEFDKGSKIFQVWLALLPPLPAIAFSILELIVSGLL